MSDMKINTELMNVEIAKLKAITLEFEELFSKIENETNALQDYWQTRTSDGVYNDFSIFYKVLENVKLTNEQDISFLEKVVNASYMNYETKANELVDRNLSV